MRAYTVYEGHIGSKRYNNSMVWGRYMWKRVHTVAKLISWIAHAFKRKKDDSRTLRGGRTNVH